MDRLRLVEGMSEGMYNLHVVLGIAWFDCKPANFLVRQLEEGDWEITPADYGFSRDALTLANEQRRYKVSPGMYDFPQAAAGAPGTAIVGWRGWVGWKVTTQSCSHLASVTQHAVCAHMLSDSVHHLTVSTQASRAYKGMTHTG